jgi:hypothetical protein
MFFDSSNLRQGPVTEVCGYGNEFGGFIKKTNKFCLAKQLSAFYERPCSMELAERTTETER